MAIEVRPATKFQDVKVMVGPKRPDASVCWCLSYRLTSSKENRELVGPARGERVRRLVRQNPPPGVLAYDGDEVVGWAAVHPRADTSFARNRKIPHVDDLDVWSVWCIRVRPGHRGEGISHDLLAGAVDFARANGAVAIEGYPVDNKGAKVDLTMAYVGTRRLFEKAGFTKVSDTDSVLNGFPRVLMRLDLRPADPVRVRSSRPAKGRPVGRKR
jgi:GNAT superfamily N-acetyltransferase